MNCQPNNEKVLYFRVIVLFEQGSRIGCIFPEMKMQVDKRGFL